MVSNMAEKANDKQRILEAFDEIFKVRKTPKK